jgi:hypothetical protein
MYQSSSVPMRIDLAAVFKWPSVILWQAYGCFTHQNRASSQQIKPFAFELAGQKDSQANFPFKSAVWEKFHMKSKRR